MSSPQLLPFFSAAAAFAAGGDTPRAFLERCLERLAEYEPTVQAFVCHDIAAARSAADRATERWRAGRSLSPIDGMPIGIKDIIETVDMPTGQGSPLWEETRTGRDAASVAALREAGAVILGKTVTTEFASSEPLGLTRNPWDPPRTPGGSSSGSAAAVGCGMVPAALGTQVVGSIIRPAIGPAPIGLGHTGNPIFAVPFSLLGVPTVSLPLFAVENLPLGLQVVGFEGADAQLFATAAWVRGQVAGRV